MIPKNIFFVYDDLDQLHEVFKENIKFIEKENPDYNVTTYSRDMIKDLLQKEKPEWLYYFNKINPIYGNLVSDYARYVLLYLFGGIYFDVKSRPKKPLNDIINEDTKLWLCFAGKPQIDIMSGFMMSEKHSSYFLKVINKFNSNVDCYHTLDINLNTPKKNILTYFSTYMLADIAKEDYKDQVILSKDWGKYGIVSVVNESKKRYSTDHYRYYHKSHYTKLREHLIL